MADDWGSDDQVVLPSYKQESNLKQIVSYSPDEQADVARQESMPFNDTELDAEMKRQANNPKALAILQQEKDKRSQSSWGQDDKVADSNWGHNDQEVKGSTFDFIPNSLNKLKEAGRSLIHEPLHTLEGAAMGVGDILTQGLRAAGDIALASGPFGKAGARLIRPDLNPTPEGILQDVQDDTNKINQAIGPTAENPAFQAGRGVLGDVFDLTGIPKVIKQLPPSVQAPINLGLTAMGPFLLKGGEKGAVKAAKTASDVVKDTEATSALQDLEGPAPTRPEAPTAPNTVYVDKQGTAVPDTLLAEYEQAKQGFQARQAEVPEGTQGELNLEPQSQPPYEKPGTIFDPENVNKTVEASQKAADQAKADALDKAFPDDHPAKDVLGEEYDKALEQREQQTNAADPLAADVDAYQPAQGGGGPRPMKFRGPRGQRGEADMFNDLAQGVFKIGDMIKDVTGRMGRVIGEDVNGYRVKTDVDGGAIYSTVARNDRIFKPADDVRLNDGTSAKVRAVMGDTLKVAVERDGGVDLLNVPKQSVSLMDRSTRKLSDIYKGQAGQGEMFKDLATFLAKGATGLRDAFIKRPDVDNYKPTYTRQEIKDIVRKGLVESNTFDTFRQRMEMEALPDIVLNRLNGLWRDKEQVIERAGQSSFSQMSDASRLQADDTKRDYQTMMKDTGFDGDKAPTQDSGLANRFLNVLNVAKLINHNKEVGPIMKWVMSNTNKIIGDGVHVYKQLDRHLEPFKALSTTEKRAFMETVIKYDGIKNKVLRENGLQWLTDDMLRKEGFNDSQVRAYQELTHALDKAWDLIEQTFREQGREPPQRIPGYFPHVWEGSYRLMVRDAKGKLIDMYAYPTLWQAKFHEKFNIKDGFKTEVISPSIYPKSNNMAATIMDHLSLDLSRPLDKAIQKKLQRSEEYAKRGIVTELLARDTNLGGYMGEKGLSGWNPVANDRVLNSYQRYIEDVANHYANSRIAKEVWNPFFKDMTEGKYDEVPTFSKTIEDFIGRATGRPENHLKIVDALSRAMMKTLGVAPEGMNTFFKGGAQLLYYTKLSAGNAMYALSQFLQPLVGIRNISRIHGERIVRGDVTGNTLKAVGTGLGEYLKWEQGQGSADSMAVMKYLRDKGIIDTHQVDAVDPSNKVKKAIDYASGFISRGLERLETRNRAATTMMFYSYFKDTGMSQTEAIRAAATQMGLIMGEYSKHQSASMYTDLGIVGHQLRPFGILRNTYLGEAYMNLQLIADAAKEVKAGRQPMSVMAKSLVPMTMMTGNMMFFAGLAGLVGYQDYNALVRFHNWLFPDNPWLEAGAKLRQLGVSTPAIYGMLGSLLPGKPNIGPSVNMPALTDAGSLPGPSAVAQLGPLISAMYSSYKNEPVDWESTSAALQRLAPGWAAQWVSEWAASKMGGNVPNSSGSFTRNTVKRTPEESTVARLTGKANIPEQARRDDSAIMERMDKADQQWVTSQVHILTDILEGFPGPELVPTIQKIIAQKRGVGDEIIDRVIRLHETRMQDTDTQIKLKMASSDGAKLQRLKQIYDMLHGR